MKPAAEGPDLPHPRIWAEIEAGSRLNRKSPECFRIRFRLFCRNEFLGSTLHRHDPAAAREPGLTRPMCGEQVLFCRRPKSKRTRIDPSNADGRVSISMTGLQDCAPGVGRAPPGPWELCRTQRSLN